MDVSNPLLVVRQAAVGYLGSRDQLLLDNRRGWIFLEANESPVNGLKEAVEQVE